VNQILKSRGARPGLNARLLAVAAEVILAVLVTAGLNAQSFPARLFGQKDGLENRSITALVQQADGHLWVATENGLFRYNGANFHEFGRASGFAEPRFFNLFIDPAQTVWAATPSGLYFLEDNRFHELRMGNEILFVGINSHITASPSGEVVLSDTRGRLYSVYKPSRDAAYSVVPFADRHPLFTDKQPVSGVFVDSSGTLWYGCPKGICSFNPALPAAKIAPPANVPPGNYDSFLEDRSGVMWARSHFHLISWRSGDTIARDLSATVPSKAFEPINRRIAQDAFGDIVLNTSKGFATWNGNLWIETNATSKGEITGATDLLADREGALWIGTPGAGLFQSLGYRQWANFTTAEGLSSADVFAVVRDGEDRVWVGTAVGLDLLDRETNRLVASPLTHEADSTWMENLVPTPDGGIWAANLSGHLWHLDARGRIDARATVPGEIQRMRLDPTTKNGRGTLWIATSGGLFTLRCEGSEACKPNRFSDPHLASQFLADFVFDTDNSLWIVGGQGLYHLRAGSVTHVNVSGAANRFSLIALGQEHTLWLAGHLPGVLNVRPNGDTAEVIAAHVSPELTSDYVEFLESDHQGRIWLGTDQGLNIIDQKNIFRITDEDGLVGNDADWKAFLADTDGSIWIGTSGGLSHLLRPAAMLYRPAFSAVIENPTYESVRSFSPDARIRWSGGTFHAHFSGLTFRDNQSLVYKYQLEGFDPSIIETRIPFARFQQLPPGHYTLRVTAEDRNHHMVSAPAELSFTLTPLWWQTSAFHLLVGVACLGLLVLIWRCSYMALLARQARLERLVEQRTGELQMLAVTDALTGLLNRGAIMTALAAEVAMARKQHVPLCVAIVDLDHFKKINDTLGHQAGDEVLRVVASRLAASIRSTDAIGRYGGEEFLILFRNVEQSFGLDRCEMIRKNLCDQPVCFQGNSIEITGSIGLGWTKSGSDVQDTLIASADRALYEAKAKGRNRVACAVVEEESLIHA
jgi:diguanylate cyclase (GGDEF)-like protein